MWEDLTFTLSTLGFALGGVVAAIGLAGTLAPRYAWRRHSGGGSPSNRLRPQ